jgi:excisionase family DNA binding protein
MNELLETAEEAKIEVLEDTDRRAIIMTLEEVCEYLKLSKETVYRRIYDKSIPCFKVGRVWRFKLREVNKWLLNNKMQPKRKPGRRDGSRTKNKKAPSVELGVQSVDTDIVKPTEET